MRRPLSSLFAFACGAGVALAVLTNSRRARALFASRADSGRRPLPSSAAGGATRPAGPADPSRHRGDAARDREAALSRRKEDFLGLLSHELRNPLSAIHVALAVMRARDSIEIGQQARSVVERQVAHIARLVEDLVDTARIERGTLSLRLEPLDLREVLRTSVEMARPYLAHRRQEFLWSPPESAMQVSGDRVRLQQVFSNLLLNASKYTPERGTIELVLSRDASDFSVSVRDNGSGIAEGDLVKVFEPFVRASHDVAGLGVGLYVARTLVEQHGGAISVTSAGAGQGATFIVRLPELSPLFRDEGVTVSSDA